MYKILTTCMEYIDFVQQTGRQIGDLAGTSYWGSGRNIRDLEGILGIWQLYWGSGRYGILGIWQVRYIGDLAGLLFI